LAIDTVRSGYQANVGEDEGISEVAERADGAQGQGRRTEAYQEPRGGSNQGDCTEGWQSDLRWTSGSASRKRKSLQPEHSRRRMARLCLIDKPPAPQTIDRFRTTDAMIMRGQFILKDGRKFALEN
jgi:hypothetical protein